MVYPAVDDKTVYQKMEQTVKSDFVPVALEVFRLLPDGVVLGTAILTMLSLSKSYGFLLLSMVELMFLQRIAATMLGSIQPLGSGPDMLHQICQPGLSFPNNMRISLLEKIGVPSLFPSPVLFFLTGILTYMIGSINEFGRELKTLGGDLKVRTTVGIVMSSVFAFVVFAFRYRYGCESFGSLLISMIFGIIAGFLVLYQNKALFGRESLNILNIPMILTASESGKPMYVCAPSSP